MDPYTGREPVECGYITYYTDLVFDIPHPACQCGYKMLEIEETFTYDIQTQHSLDDIHDFHTWCVTNIE